MNIRNIAAIVMVSTAFAGCGVSVTCDDPERYQQAREGTRVDAPDDLDDLRATRELTIPKASPRDARPVGSRCLDLPPPVQAE